MCIKYADYNRYFKKSFWKEKSICSKSTMGEICFMSLLLSFIIIFPPSPPNWPVMNWNFLVIS